MEYGGGGGGGGGVWVPRRNKGVGLISPAFEKWNRPKQDTYVRRGQVHLERKGAFAGKGGQKLALERGKRRTGGLSHPLFVRVSFVRGSKREERSSWKPLRTVVVGERKVVGRGKEEERQQVRGGGTTSTSVAEDKCRVCVVSVGREERFSTGKEGKRGRPTQRGRKTVRR